MLVNPTHPERGPFSLKTVLSGESKSKASSVEELPTHPVDTVERAQHQTLTAGPSKDISPPIPEPLLVASEDVSPADLAKLRTIANEATAYFQAHFGEVKKSLRFEVGKVSQALRTGYNFQTDTICLPNLSSVKNRGLDSVDVIRHEIFHALIIGSYPEMCPPETLTQPASVRVHEGLADYFAHQMQPDNVFGEQFYQDAPHVREYRNGLSINLATGAHAQGNALTSHLLENNVSNDQVRQFLAQGDFSLNGLGAVNPDLKAALRHDEALSVEVEASPPYPNSKLHRYRLEKDVPLEITLSASEKLLESHPGLHVVWTDVKGMPSRQFVVEETGPGKFSVSPAPEAHIEKLIARYHDKDTLIGFHPFYFSTKD